MSQQIKALIRGFDIEIDFLDVSCILGILTEKSGHSVL